MGHEVMCGSVVAALFEPVVSTAASSPEVGRHGETVAYDVKWPREGRPLRVLLEVLSESTLGGTAEWLVHLAMAEHKYKMPAVLVVLALDQISAESARARIAGDPVLALRSLVVGPADLAPIDPIPLDALAGRDTLCSTEMHVQGLKALPVLIAALDRRLHAPNNLDGFHRYVEMVFKRLPPSVIDVLRHMMESGTASLPAGLHPLIPFLTEKTSQAPSVEGPLPRERYLVLKVVVGPDCDWFPGFRLGVSGSSRG